MGYNLMNDRNEKKNLLKIENLLKLTPLALKDEISWWFEFLKNQEDLHRKSCQRERPSSNIFQNSNCRINLVFTAGASNLVILVFSICSISGILKVITHNMKEKLLKPWSRDPGCKGPLVFFRYRKLVQ